jgi:hypothetical protein
VTPRPRVGGPELPHAPLELLHPLELPGAEITGITVWTEVGGAEGLSLYRLIDMVLVWTIERGARWDAVEVEDFELYLLTHPDPSFGQPCGLLTGLMASAPTTHSEKEVAWACLCIAEWASGKRFRKTAAEFARAAALACTEHPRYACLAAELMHASGELSQAEHWYRRARRLAVWKRDRICEVRASSRLAEIASRTEAVPNMKVERGNGGTARHSD